MTTEAQVAANRLNAQKSTGPRTEEGKAKVALNAVTHGLRAQGVVLSAEEPGEYERYRERLLAELQPRGLQDQEQAERIVGLAWQLRRAGRYHSAVFAALCEQQAAAEAAAAGAAGDAEAGGLELRDGVLGRMLVADFSGPRVLERVQLYERRIENSLFRARAEWDQRHAQPWGSAREGLGRERTGAVAAAATPAGGQGLGCTNKPKGASPAAGQRPGVNKQSQWQPLAAGGWDLGRATDPCFGSPMGIMADLAAHKRLPARRAI
ncbi:MAG: hypothetical protein MUC88_05185 [Planctomycetes bacterium]|jgi:hypothetical protein|nr:hypothetical protein [Planctomycetota bacterium]